MELILTYEEVIDLKYALESAHVRTDDNDSELQERVEILLDKINNHELS